MDKLMDISYSTISILKSESNLTSTIPRVVKVCHLNLVDIKIECCRTTSITGVKIPVRLCYFGINRLSDNNTRLRATSILRLNMNLSMTTDISYLI